MYNNIHKKGDIYAKHSYSFKTQKGGGVNLLPLRTRGSGTLF